MNEAASDPAEDGWCAAARRLMAVMAKENAALEARDGQRLRDLVGEKQAAAHAYEQALRDDATRLSDAAFRARIRPVAEQLQRVVEENERRLTVVLLAQRRVLSLVADAARDLAPGPRVYGRRGDMARGRGVLPLAVDRAL